MTDSGKPVTRVSSAMFRDRGLRAVVATIHGGVLILRCKGLKSRVVLDLGWCYSQGVKQKVAAEKADRRRAKKEGRS